MYCRAMPVDGWSPAPRKAQEVLNSASAIVRHLTSAYRQEFLAEVPGTLRG